MKEVASFPISTHAQQASSSATAQPSLSGTRDGRAVLLANRACNSNPTRRTGPLPRSGPRAANQWHVPARTLRVVPGLGGSRCCCIGEARPVLSAPGTLQLLHHSDRYFGEVLFLFPSHCNGYDFRAGMHFARRLPFCPQALPRRPRATVISGSLSFATRSILRLVGPLAPPPARSFLCCALANKPGGGGFLIANPTPVSAPFSDPGKARGEKVPPAISAGKRPSAPRPSAQ